MWAIRSLPKVFWQSLALIALPAAALVGLEIYHATGVVPDLGETRRSVSHTFQVMEAARMLDQSVQDAERGQRGFIITGNPDYLGPYTTGIQEAPDRLAQLKTLTSDNADQQRRLALLEDQIKNKMTEMKRTVEVRH